VKLGIKTAVLAGGLLTALCAVGCGASAGGAGSVRPVTVQGCAAYGVYAIEHHITVTRKPAPCRGLSRAELNQAAATAILRVAGGGPKGAWRRQAAQVARFLNYMITGPAPEASSPPVSPPWSGSAPVSRPLGGRDLAMDTAALVAWLITAGSGSHVLVTWISRGGSMRPGAGATGSPPTVIFGHFGLALGGLVIWVTYLVAGWTALAWTAVGVLLPVAGLGMATVTIGLPSRSPAVATSGAIPAVGNIRSGGGSTGPVPPRRRLSPLLVVGHGLLAVTTMALVLLAALGPAAT
jgi:manganese efflux pump family protein